ncbi:protein arginine N-methyltransferase 1 [Tribolium castaneum]|uniref:type I protein arginine methyltransferase n=1 Tax=Tribolium castaneum TaxID=7070 RepID=D1ZZP4_TRICA|nr:PREDICTED: protein arginine N-methyltransferase 1 [Tribolium castaneum]EFA02398.1 putative histone-arginine methyltransferase CARMER-like Protein [Tribolium castaneum]|eukprot:XP_974375.1 PREDICTED: protein arginine N-methyltransferase 1 [Tribolium castaneum]
MDDEDNTCRDGDDDSDEWDEMEVTGEQTTCLFCPLQFLTIAVALDHCRAEHNFDLLELKNKYNMDCYSYIKMINYIRMQRPDPKILTESSVALWDDDVYLKAGEMESWLMYDFEDLGSAPSTPHYAIDGKTPISNLNFSDLQRQIEDLTLQLKHKCTLLELAVKDIEKMKKITRTFVESRDVPEKPFHVTGYDSDYFHSYSHFGIHHEMLNDRVRTESYRDAILNNSDSFKDKIVLDVGCGTGILSLFSAKAGASKVIGIDQSEVVYKAMDIIRENNYYDTIHLMKGRIEDTNLPVEKVDIIVSEWMGYFLLFEGMLDSFIHARDRYLAPGGLLLPNRCNLNLIGCSDPERYDKVINFWDNVYGFSMKCMKSEVISEAFVETVPGESVMTDPITLKEIDLASCTVDTCDFSSAFALKATKDAVLTCLVGYFDTFFDLPKSVHFSTGPEAPKTHWQQSVFYLKETINMSAGDVIEGSLVCSRLKKNARGLSVTITLGKNKYHYNLD